MALSFPPNRDDPKSSALVHIFDIKVNQMRKKIEAIRSLTHLPIQKAESQAFRLSPGALEIS